MKRIWEILDGIIDRQTPEHKAWLKAWNDRAEDYERRRREADRTGARSDPDGPG